MNRRRQKKLSRRLVTAAWLGRTAEAEALLRAGAPPGTPDPDGTTPLYAAAVHGADPNLREDHGTGHTPLSWAIRGPHPETAEALRAAGASD
ncbi:ankyrin repeat domain-containing protein [Streptomyces sp. NPDC002054]|uniref:ankyrin repeat domain-containing protein n=1 Tax=Streptomyces sp. NPDC002054 TaxID=3154663 RepID=UPI00331BFA3F